MSKKELPEGIYNYETTGSGIQIIIELISGLFEIVHNLSVCGYSYQYQGCIIAAYCDMALLFFITNHRYLKSKHPASGFFISNLVKLS